MSGLSPPDFRRSTVATVINVPPLLHYPTRQRNACAYTMHANDNHDLLVAHEGKPPLEK
jgi:hypothetical protein